MSQVSGRVHQPRTRDFVRLKLRIIGNGLRGSPRRVTLFVFGVGVGLALAVGGFALFASAAARPRGDHGQFGLVVLAFLGTGLVLAWVFAPLLFFGVDETLDPARFALLPLSRRTLAAGMLAAACVGIPAIATGVASLGLVMVGAIRGGLPGAAVGLAGALVGLLLCVVASRAVTSAFAGLLRSRRTRDLAAIAIAVLASSCGPVQLLVSSLLRRRDVGAAVPLARVLSWTPLGAPYAAVLDADRGDWLAVAGRFAIGLAGVGLLLAWWSATLEAAKVGTATSGSPGARRSGAARPVDALFPRLLRAVPRTRFGAVLARECRYWWRDPRRRAGLVSLTMAGVVVPVALRFAGRGGSTPLPVAMAFAGVLTGTVLANQFGNDGAALAVHVLAGVPGRLELRARVAGLATVMVPIVLVTTVAVAVATGAVGQVPAALGVALAGFGCSAAVASLFSVYAAYALPETANPFAMGGGSAGAKGLLAFVGMVASMVLLAPVLLLALVTRHGALVAAVGLTWAAAAILAGTFLAGHRLDARRPELLMAVTPRR